jgi:hypothetical protein
MGGPDVKGMASAAEQFIAEFTPLGVRLANVSTAVNALSQRWLAAWIGLAAPYMGDLNCSAVHWK